MMNISGCQYFRFFARDIYHGTIACQACYFWLGVVRHAQSCPDISRLTTEEFVWPVGGMVVLRII